MIFVNGGSKTPKQQALQSSNSNYNRNSSRSRESRRGKRRAWREERVTAATIHISEEQKKIEKFSVTHHFGNMVFQSLELWSQFGGGGMTSPPSFPSSLLPLISTRPPTFKFCYAKNSFRHFYFAALRVSICSYTPPPLPPSLLELGSFENFPHFVLFQLWLQMMYNPI